MNRLMPRKSHGKSNTICDDDGEWFAGIGVIQSEGWSVRWTCLISWFGREGKGTQGGV